MNAIEDLQAVTMAAVLSATFRRFPPSTDLDGSTLLPPTLHSYRPLRAALRWVVVPLSLVLSAAAALGFSGTAGAASAKPSVTRSAFYFGAASPINFWSSDMSGAPAAFQQIKADGFNAVELAVPWGEFQESVSPATYNAAAFKSLASLVALAKATKLEVILRLSYGVDIDPHDQAPDRSVSVFSNQTVYNSWLGYISHVHQAVAKYNDVQIAQLSWEDFWNPVAEAQAATTVAQRVQLASTTGLLPWLKSNYSLSQVSKMYQTKYTSWSDVPTPSSTTPSFKLMYQYDDYQLVHRFFVPAAARFPGLNLEARVDIDPLYSGTKVVGSYSHADTFKLPGTSYIGMYFSPYLGDPSTALTETTKDALAALNNTLASMRSRAGNRPLFIFEYEIVSNSPEVADDPGLPASSVPSFILASAPILRKYTLGYSLWTYHDYAQSPLYNPSFALGSDGWSVSGSATAAKAATGTSLSLGAATTITQEFPLNYLAANPGSNVTVSMSATTAGAPSTITVKVGSAPPRTFTATGAQSTYAVQIPTSEVIGLPNSQLTISSSAPVSITNVQISDFTQLGDIYSVNGTPGVGAAPLRTLNQQLATGSSGS
jgi:hypothetical protein